MANNEYVDPTKTPATANAAIAAILSTGSAGGTKPVVVPPADPVTRLPGGLVLGMDVGDVQYAAEVQELTGVHEEKITKARQSGRMASFYKAILECGLVSIGGKPVTREMADSLLIGDADYLLREIRRVTYGDEMNFTELVCPHCQGKYDLALTLDDIPVRVMKSSADRIFTVKLRRGKSAVVRLPVGADRDDLANAQDKNTAELNTLLLSRCVQTIIDAKGTEHAVDYQHGPVQNLSIPDRQTLLTEITDRQPGPQFDAVTYLHEPCGQEVRFEVSIGDLFLGL